MKNQKNRVVDNVGFAVALLIGAIAVLWMGFVFVHTHVLAFSIIIIIGSIYSIGVMELLRFRKATSTLSTALNMAQEKVTALEEWLACLDPSIQNAVRARIQGAHVGLPAPVLTPYFLGLLVMLGLLALVALGSYGVACAGLADSFEVPATCDTNGAVEVFKAFFAAVLANQVTFLIGPKKGE